MTPNKHHWYDGWFYDRIIAPNQDKLFNQIKSYIEPGSTVIDVGCGTGRFSFFVKDKCRHVLGIDISKKNIDYALSNLSRNPAPNLKFMHKGVSEVEVIDKFDYAVITFVLHEISEEERMILLKEVSAIAGKVIIGEYLVPKPAGFWSVLNEAVEFAAGKDHYNNYKNFVRNGGLQALARKSGLKIIYEEQNNPSTSHLAVLEKISN